MWRGVHAGWGMVGSGRGGWGFGVCVVGRIELCGGGVAPPPTPPPPTTRGVVPLIGGGWLKKGGEGMGGGCVTG